MKTKNLLILTLFFFPVCLFGQGQIIAPDNLCPGECAEIFYSEEAPDAQMSWFITYNGIGQTASTGSSVYECFPEPGFAFIHLELTGPNGNTQIFSDTLTIGVGAGSFDIVADPSCRELSPDSCQQVCAFTTVTYSIDNQTNQPVVWTVNGAVDFVVDNNTVTVDWGEPGQGYVSVSTLDSMTTPYSISCGQSTYCDQSPTGMCQGFVEVSGGVGPYEVNISTPNGASEFIGFFEANDISFEYPEPGTYIITVIDATGNEAQCWIELSNAPTPNCDFPPFISEEIMSPSGPNNCDGTISVSVSGGTAPFLFNWSNGQTSSSLSGICCGTYSLTITDSDNCDISKDFIVPCSPTVNCSAFAEICVNILAEPVAAFSTEPAAVNDVVNICQGQTVFFQNESLNAENFTWDFGPGQVFNDVNANYTYNNPGTFTASLIAANACYCADTTTVTIIVDPSVGPEIDCVGTICEGETITYTSSSDCSIFNWNVSANGTITEGGGTGDDFITIQWGDGPIGTINLAVDNCMGDFCNVPSTVQIPIISDNATIAGPAAVCNESTATYSLPNYSGTEYIWSVSNRGTITDGQGTPEITVEWSSGTIPLTNQQVMVDYFNCYLECGGADQLAVSILPEFYLTGPIEACQNEFSEYTILNAANNNSLPANWTVMDQNGTPVSFAGNGTATITVDWSADNGNYIVSALPLNGADYCSTEDATLAVKVEAPPVVPSGITGASEVCPSGSYRYRTTGLPGHIFQWEINNGGTILTEEGQQVNVTWAANGPYGISVQQKNISGPGCLSLPTTLSITPITNITINELTDACADQLASYTATTLEDVEYEWSTIPASAGTIVEGQGSEQVNVLWHTQGNAQLVLDVCGSNETINVTIRPKPDPMVNYPAGLCELVAGSVSTTQIYSTYEWRDEFGGFVSNDASPDLFPGYYELIVTDNFGCEENTSFYIETLPAPVITISTPGRHGYCPGLGTPPVLYALDDPEGYTYQWQFQGAAIAGETGTQTIGDQFGTYTVVVTDANGCTNVSNNLTIYDLCSGGEPGPGNPSPTCISGTNVTFDRVDDGTFCDVRTYQNTSSNYIPGTLFWYYKLGDNSTSFSMDEMPEYRYEKAGYYKVYLVAQSTDALGQTIFCRDVMIDTIPVSADFEYEGACIGEQINFTDLSTFLPSENIVDWQWDFGDPASGGDNVSSLESPVHTFTNNGTYQVMLTVTNDDGCQSVKVKDITIYNNPAVDFNQPPATCEATAVEFIFSGTTNVIDIEWDFGDPGSGDANSSFIENTYHSYDTPGNYTVTMTVTNIYGCSATMSKVINIEANNLTGTIGLSQPSPICEGDQIMLTAPTGGVAWSWSTGENTEQITVGLEDVYGVTITDSEGCTYAPPASIIEVIPAPNGTIRVVEYDDFDQPAQYIYGSYGTCEGEDVFMEIEGNSGYSYSWTGGSNQTSIEFSEDRGNLLAAGTYQYLITITDNSTGCTNITAPMNIEIYPLPAPFTISANLGGVICAGNTVTYSVDSPDGSLTYLWNNEEVGTSITVEEPGDYYAIAVSAFGCERTSNILTLNPGPDINLVPSGCHTRCNPDTLCLPPIPGIVSYQWYFNGVPVPAPNGNELELIATESGAYQLEMTDVIGCTLLSEALTLDLYDGVGDISGTVYFDQNDNGLIDPTDSILTDIPISLDDVNGLVGTINTNQDGKYLFDNVPSTDYRLTLDTTVLAPNHQALVAKIDTVLTGCDQEIIIDWLIIEVCETFTTTLLMNTCDGAPVIYEGETLPAGATTPVTLTASNGCDSVVQVTVINNNSVTENEIYSTCGGTTYDYYGTMINAGATQQFNFATVNGCDSTVFVTVNELSITTGNEIFTACTGQSIIYEGTSMLAGTTQDFTLIGSQGCDSIVTVTITEILPQAITETYTVCADESYDYSGTMISAGTTESFSFTGYQGCDSIVTVIVDAYAPLSLSLSTDIICPGSSMGEIEINNVNGGASPYQYSINGNAPQTELIFTDLTPGDYSVIMTDANNCQQEEQITIENYAPVELTFEEVYTIPCEAESILLRPTAISGFTSDLVLTWEGIEEGTEYEVSTPGIYTVEATNFCGSQAFAVNVGLADFEGDIIYIPNAFSPNGDGINDVFKPSMSVLSEVVDYELSIFARWGTRVFSSQDVQLGWDGGAGRSSQNSGVYIYTLSAKVNVCGRTVDVIQSGDITLLR